MNNRVFNFIIVFFFSFSAFAVVAPVVGKVSRLKAPVTILELGQHAARELKQGESVTEGSSVLTQEKSFAIIIFNDGHQLTVSPNSKVVITQVKKDNPDVVQLLMGKVRASVRPNGNKKEERFFIKTRSAAIGVRGTDFQTSYNPSNSITTLLTFSGKVAMNAIDEKTAPIADNQTVVMKLREVLSATSSVESRTGDYAGTTGEKINPPVKISPVQLTLLKINEDPEQVKELSKEELEKEVEKTKNEYAKLAISVVKKEIPVVRAGGLVDLASGFYIPPTDKSEFDKLTQVYIQKDDIGTLKQDGSYLPPEGLKVDALKGFVVDEEKKKKESEELAKKLNNEIQKQVKPIFRKSSLEEESISPYERYYKHQ